MVADFDKKGTKIIDGVTSILNNTDMGNVLSVSGHPSWSFINIKGHTEISIAVIKNSISSRDV